MNLERIEELCLRYLGQAVNPLVPVAKLHAYLVREEAEQAPSLQGLLHFLRHHAEILVLEGPGGEDPVDAAQFAEAGIMMGPRALVKTRVPSRRQMLAMMFEQIAEMREKLDEALQDARQNRDTDRAIQVHEAIQRAEMLRHKVEQFAQASTN